jgi:amidohydrolase
MRELTTEEIEAIKAAAAKRAALVEATWRELHAIPEPSRAEHKTTRYISDFLAARGIGFTPTTTTGTGGIAVVGEGEIGAILRADIDALEVVEQTGLEFASTNPGFMHACGHDVHTASLLAAADALASGEVEFEGRVVFLFQPAEERYGGMLELLNSGLLENYPAKHAFALHVWPKMVAGEVGVSQGPVMAGNDTVKLTVIGKSGHGAHPHECIDPIVTAANIITALQTVVSRRVNPTESVVLTFAMIHGGTVVNAIPERVEISGSLRWLTPEVRTLIHTEIERIAVNTARAYGAECEVEITAGYPPNVNDHEVAGTIRDALSHVLGQDKVVQSPATMGSEDRSYLSQRIPGCYVTLGAGSPDGQTKPLHNPGFVPDTSCFETAVTLFLTAAVVL